MCFNPVLEYLLGYWDLPEQNTGRLKTDGLSSKAVTISYL